MRYVTRRLHLQLAMPPSFWAAFFIVVMTGCTAGPPEIPYPAFVQADLLAARHSLVEAGASSHRLAITLERLTGEGLPR